MNISSYFVQFKHSKMHLEESTPMDRNAFELFCMSVYTDYIPGLYKKFQAATSCDLGLEY